MEEHAFGDTALRREDERLLTGHGQFTDDFNLAEQTHAYFLRSPHAHAKLVSINTRAAADRPGVVAIFTGPELDAAGLAGLPCLAPVDDRDGNSMKCPPRPLLAIDRVRHAGEPLVMIVAESSQAAQVATELVEVEFEPLSAVIDPRAATSPEAPRVHDDIARNIGLRWQVGDVESTASAIDRAPHVTTLELVNNRLVSNPLEPRNAIGVFKDGRYTLICANQGGHLLKDSLTTVLPDVSEEQIQVITPDVGGGFGTKIPLYCEAALVLWAAKTTGRPVKWSAERTEGFLSDTQGRDVVTHAELAHDSEGRFLGLRLQTTANLGAHLSAFGPEAATGLMADALTGAYDIPAASFSVVSVYTNTVPIDVYRGVGRCEAAYVLERLVDAVARKLAVEPSELRRRNFVRQRAMPHTLLTGVQLADVDFENNMDNAMQNADWTNMAQRRVEAASRGRVRGIGMSSYIGTAGNSTFPEEAAIVFESDGDVAVHVGTQSTGQGHETAFSQIVAGRLGTRIDRIRFVQGDTDAIPFGVGTFASRSLGICGSAISMAADQVVAKATKIAAHLMEVAQADVEFSAGTFRIRGTDRNVSLADVAVAARDPAIAMAAGVEPGLDARVRNDQYGASVASGCHICEVEVDESSGAVEIVRYTAVDDFGRVANPAIVEGQVQGGVTQGIGQSLLERTVYDEASGQLLSASFLDYCIPRADDLPFFHFSRVETPCTTNPLGIKGCGEAGAIAAPPAVMNAVVDALAAHGVDDVEMPATPARVWHAIQRAKRATKA